nr:MAG TPA: PROTEIN/DNA Complex catalytic motif, Helix-turn-helix DNA [Caudoviricetes sp.]
MLNAVDIWSRVPNFPQYEANRLGEIRNVSSGKRLTPFNRNGRSLYVRLYSSSGKTFEKTVASVIWAAFFKRWPTDSYVCHFDGDVENNALDNLYLGSRADISRTRRRLDDAIWDRLKKEGNLDG